jgi:hypothetical protein
MFRSSRALFAAALIAATPIPALSQGAPGRGAEARYHEHPDWAHHRFPGRVPEATGVSPVLLGLEQLLMPSMRLPGPARMIGHDHAQRPMPPGAMQWIHN